MTDCFSCVFLSFFLPLFFIEIIFGFHYDNDINCISTTFHITIGNWFVIKGFSFTLTYFTILFYTFNVDNYNKKLYQWNQYY